MTHRWVKRGLLVEPAGQAPWIGTHAALPVVVPEGAAHRIYFSTRDGAGRSHIGYCDVVLDRPSQPPGFAANAVLSPGRLGAFDDAGVTSSCVVTQGRRRYLFYTGWMLGVSVPFYMSTGVAVSEDGGNTFARISEAPLLDRSDVDPYLNASPWVLVEGSRWRMWYVSGSDWIVVAGAPRHRYHIKYAESDDGVVWRRYGTVCIDYATPDEYAFGRPCVVRDGGMYRMWYSVRGSAYSLGYAESADGIGWTRMDREAGLAASDTGWDAEMIAYPHVFRHGDHLHMMYNGNGYGRTGIGHAVTE